MKRKLIILGILLAPCVLAALFIGHKIRVARDRGRLVLCMDNKGRCAPLLRSVGTE